MLLESFCGNKTLCIFLCFAVNCRLLTTFSNACSSEVFHVALFATVVFPCSIQYSFLLVHFEKKTQFIFVSIWLYRDFIWVPTQPTLVWSWADAHATDTIDIERGDYNFRYAAWNSGHVTSLRCFGKLAWHGVMKTSLAEGSNAWDKPPW